MKTILTSIAFALAATASQALVFDFHWSSESALGGHSADPYTATGSIEIDAGVGEMFNLDDIVGSNISVSGPGISGFTVTSWTSAGGTIAADGLSAVFSAAGNPFSLGSNFFGCYFPGCSQSTIRVREGGDAFNFEYGSPSAALASLKMTRDAGMAPVPLPAGGLLLIGALGALGLARRRA